MLRRKDCFSYTKLGLSLAFLVVPFDLYSQDQSDNFQVDLFTEFPLSGNLSVDDELLVGAELKYFFSRNDTHQMFTAFGYRTDIEKEGRGLDLFNVDLGGQYNLPNFWGKRSYLEYAIGAAYLNEDFSIELLDRTVNQSFSNYGYKASIGLGFEFNNGLNTRLSVNQFDGVGTTLGINFSVSF